MLHAGALPPSAGGLLWSPLACAVLLIALSPSREAEEQSRREEVEMAVDKVPEGAWGGSRGGSGQGVAACWAVCVCAWRGLREER